MYKMTRTRAERNISKVLAGSIGVYLLNGLRAYSTYCVSRGLVSSFFYPKLKTACNIPEKNKELLEIKFILNCKEIILENTDMVV